VVAAAWCAAGCVTAPHDEAGASAADTGALLVSAEMPHDPDAFTQGLLWHQGMLFEGTGLYGRSELRHVEPHTGRVVAAVTLPDSRFGEGIAVVQDRIYQLTWQSGIAYVYDIDLRLLDSVAYPGEGWGLTANGVSLILADGSDTLRIVSPGTFALERVVHVRRQGQPVAGLNELEFVDGEVLANLFGSDTIARIDLATGEVLQMIDASHLYPLPGRARGTRVLNGIAVKPGGALLLTGKYWPSMFEVRLRRTP
jgi:glutamine cyclotransferase